MTVNRKYFEGLLANNIDILTKNRDYVSDKNDKRTIQIMIDVLSYQDPEISFAVNLKNAIDRIDELYEDDDRFGKYWTEILCGCRNQTCNLWKFAEWDEQQAEPEVIPDIDINELARRIVRDYENKTER